MAFSTFRGMMAASSSLVPILPNNYFVDVSRIVQPSGNIAQNYFTFISGASSSQCYAAFTPSSGYIYTALVTASSSGPTVNITGALSLAANTAVTTNPTITGDVIDSTHYVVAYINNNNKMIAKYITNSSGTLNVTTIYTSSTNIGSPSSSTSSLNYLTLDGTHALIAGVGATTSQIEMINPTAGTMYTSGTGSWASTVNLYGVGLSSSLAAYVYLDGSNHINIQTIDISGSSITINTAVASTPTLITAGARIGIAKIDSTHVLLTYIKSNSVMASMIATIGVGGSVTYSSETIQTISNLFPSTSPAQLVTLSASEYAVIYGRTDIASGSDLYNGYVVQGLSINGTAITYGTVSTIVTQPCYNQFNTANSYTWGMAIGLSSSKLLFAYNAITNATGTFSSGNIIRVVPVEVGNTPGWSSTWVNNTLASALTLNAVPSGVAASIPIGNDYMLMGYPSTYAVYMLVNNDYTYNYYDSITVSSGVTSIGLGLCGLYPVNSSSGLTRAFTASIDTSNNLTAQVISIGSAGTLSLGTASSAIDTSVLNGYPVCAQMSANTVLVCYTKSTGIFAVVVTTNATTGIASFGTPVNIYSGAFSGSNISLIALSSTRFLASFTNVSSQGSSVLGTVSGSTVTANATNTFAASAENPISSCLLTSSNGIIAYRAAGEMQAVTFSYSGNTLNQSTATTFSSTGASVKNVQSPNGMLVPVDSTHAMAMYYDGSGQVLYANLLASTGYNNFTAGTQYTISSSIVTGNVNYGNIGLASGAKITGSIAAVSANSAQVIYMNRV